MTTTAATGPRGLGLARRTVSGVALAALVLGSIATVPTFTLVVLAITLLSLWELAGLTARKGQALIFPVAAVAVATYIVLAAMNLQHAYEKTLLGLTKTNFFPR